MAMKKILNIYKPLGMTPLEAIELFRKKNLEYKNIKMGYAGRLDPLAEGVLLVLTGNELKKQNNYFKLNKTYTAEILLGYTTDTYDILGLVEKGLNLNILNKKIENTLKKFENTFSWSIPPFSSQKIKGKSLFWWARQNKLNEIKIPNKIMQFSKIEILNIYSISSTDLLNIIKYRINLVKGDFRQKEINEKWTTLLTFAKKKKFLVIVANIDCTSGSYIRSLAHRFGVELKVGALLLHLRRTSVGKFNINQSIKI